MSDPTMVPVSSSTIHSIGYDPKSSQLHVIYTHPMNKKSPSDFKYVFEGVPPTTYAAFLSAKSKGKFNSDQIKPKFTKFSKVRRTPPALG